MPTIVDLCGKRFTRWEVLERAPIRKDLRTWWLCRCSCGTVREVNGGGLCSGGSKSCGCLARELSAARKGSVSKAWKGGHTTSRQGYILIQTENRGISKRRLYRPEHVLVMENHLGRLLRPKDVIHHKNGIRDDNRLENLELWSCSHPHGQRIEDKVAWCKEFLQAYAPVILRQ